MRHGSLFSGIGGFDLAAEWMGWENVFHCEWNEFGKKVLKHYWPKAISYADITKSDFTIHRGNIDILTGGFPCQPYSVAGKRKGKEDERHLWPEMLRAIREIQPRWVVGENVRGLINWNGGLVFDEVQADLEAIGYEVLPFLLPACAVNAPHRRDRIWFIAHSKCNNDFRTERGSNGETKEMEEVNRKENCTPWKLSGTDSGNNEWEEQKQYVTTNTLRDGQQFTAEFTENNRRGVKKRVDERYQSNSLCGIINAANTNSKRIQGRQTSGNTSSERKISEQFIGRYDQLNDWSEFPTQSPVCNGDDGLSSRLDGITFSKWRNESIKAGGNAVVPQVVYQIFKAIEQYESL